MNIGGREANMSELEENNKKVERYIQETEYYPYFSLKKINDGDFDKDFDNSVFMDKDIVEIFNIIGNLNGIRQQILEYLYDTLEQDGEFLKKEYNKNMDYLNKKKELLLKLKGSEQMKDEQLATLDDTILYIWKNAKHLNLKDINRMIQELKEVLEKDENKEGKKLIQDFLYKIRHIPLFLVIDDDGYLQDVYEEIDKIRDFYQKEINKKK